RRLPSSATLFPYTTLFRSDGIIAVVGDGSLDFIAIVQPAQLLQGYHDLQVGYRQCRQFAQGIDTVTVYSDMAIKGSFVQPIFQGDRKSTRLNSSHVKISYA